MSAYELSVSVVPGRRSRRSGVRAAILLALFAASVHGESAVFVNELHYDNAGTDIGEAIEIAGPAGTDLTGWTIVLYNGSGGATYATEPLGGPIPDLGGGFGVVTVLHAGIQNGAPDGLALVNRLGMVLQFLCYEGTFQAQDGPAAGQTCVDIGVLEDGSEPAGQSLQLAGSGACAGDFLWQGPAASTFGLANTGQTLTGECLAAPAVLINEILADPGMFTGDANGDGISSPTDDEFVEFVNVSPGALDLSGWTLRVGGVTRHTMAPGAMLGSGCALVVFGGGTPVGGFGGALVAKANTGGLALTDSGSLIELDSGGSAVFTASYGAEGGQDESLNLNPDLTGTTRIRHSLVAGSSGRLFSPGQRVTATPFPCSPGPLLSDGFESGATNRWAAALP